MKSMRENQKREEFLKSLSEYKTKESYHRERYSAPRGTAHKANQKKSKKRAKTAKNIRNAMIGTMLILGAFGSMTALNKYKEDNRKITLEEAIQLGKTPYELGINSDIFESITQIEQQLNDSNISNIDLLQSAIKINDLRFDVERSKIGNILGVSQDQQDQIEIATERYIGAGETLRVGEYVYTTQGSEGTISKDIAKYIRETGELQSYCINIQNHNFDRKDVVKRLKKDIKKVSKFAASEMKRDDKNNISIDWTTQKELKAQENQIDRDY